MVSDSAAKQNLNQRRHCSSCTIAWPHKTNSY